MTWKFSSPILILAILLAGSLVVNQEEKITLYGRRSSSGTFIYFRNHVVENEYSGKMYNMIGNETIVQAVKNDKTGIGYVGVGYALTNDDKPIDGIKILEIAKDENHEPASPLDPTNVKTGKYPIARPLYQYTDSIPQKGSLTYDFLKFELSAKGENITTNTGLYPILPKDRNHNENNLEKAEESESGKNGTLTIKGSDTELQLVSNFAEAYSENHPNAEITVAGGGSGTGIAALIGKRTDIADSSRKIKAEEFKEAKNNGVNPVEFIIARDCITIIANKDNPIENLTLEEVSKIFSGKITSWKELGEDKNG